VSERKRSSRQGVLFQLNQGDDPRSPVLRRASAWLRRELRSFDPRGQNTDLDEARRTALAELALLCLLLRRLPPGAGDYGWLVEPATQLLVRAFRRKEVHSFLFEGPVAAFAGHLLIWLALPPEIAEGIVTRSELQTLLDKRNVTRVERTPTRLLELRYLLDLADLRHKLPGWRALYRGTLAASRPVTESLEPSDIYAITHTIFYVTDFGREPARALSGAERARLIQLTDELQERMIRARHWDLVAELILTRCCLAEPRSRADGAGWEALARAQAAEGAFLSPAAQHLVESLASGPEERRELIFLASYHTCLVAVLAGAVAACLETAERRQARGACL
jgi:hypothetical protein